MSHKLALPFLCFLSLSLSSGVTASSPEDLDWSQWRGQGRDAVSHETGLVDQWGDQGPEIVWRIDAGDGFSSVSVSRNRLYTLWDEGDGQFLFCLDAVTGQELWRRKLGPAFQHHYGNGPRSTPLIDDGIVYAIGTAGLLLAADQQTGKTIWERDLVSDFDADLPSYGYASSPLLAGVNLILEVGGESSAFAALDKKTGKIAWTAGNDQPAYSSPIAIEVAGMHQVVFWSAHGLHAVAVDTGELLWHHSRETFCPITGNPLNTGTPIFIAPDRIFVSSGEGAEVIHIASSASRTSGRRAI